MAPPARPHLVSALVTLVDDAFFGVTAMNRYDAEAIVALWRRRATTYAGAVRGAAGIGMDAWDPWLLTMCAAIAPIAPPRWMPMADAIGELSLEHGARGMRSLFTSKPSDKEVARVRRMGALIVRVLGAVLAADGAFHQDALLLRATLVASLGLPEEDQKLLNAEAPMPAEALDIYGDFDAKLARSIVRGAFYGAMCDGLDPREEQAIGTCAKKFCLSLDDLNAARNDARKEVDGVKAFGEAACDAIRFVIADDGAEAERLAVAAARLVLPSVHRREIVTSINVGGQVVLGRKHEVEKKQRDAALALAWLSALRGDPSVARRAELAFRHDQVALDLGAREEGADVRADLDDKLQRELCVAIGGA